MIMKLREGWKRHGNCWKYKETPLGFASEYVIQFTEHGLKRFEAHYTVNGICGFAYSSADFCRCRKFDDREAAFKFCEEKYRERVLAQ